MHAVQVFFRPLIRPHIVEGRDLFRYVVLVTTIATGLALTLDTIVQLACFESWSQVYRQWSLDIIVTVMTAAPVTFLIGTTHRELRVAKLAYKTLSETDPLTGLPNRRRFTDAIEAAPGLKALAIIDIDHFKGINDAFGHEAGDTVLQIVSEILRAELGPAYMAGRIGGEEFAAYAPIEREDDFIARVEAFRVRLADHAIRICDHPCRVTASVGVACQADGEPLSRLFVNADAAMYRAKVAGRNRVSVTSPARAATPIGESAPRAA